jgi:single-strand DNA-binding protein
MATAHLHEGRQSRSTGLRVLDKQHWNEREREPAMSKSVNKVILLGNLGKDAEVKALQSGTTVAHFSLATTERYKDKSGEWQDKTEWHNVLAYGRTAEIVRDYTEKGSKVYVEGKLTTRSWDDEDSGKKIYRTEVVVLDVGLMSNKNGGNNGSNDRAGDKSTGRSASNSRSKGRQYDDVGDGLGIDASEIPF